MSEGGYTLAETLAALAVLGMAMGGLSTGLHTLGGVQRSASVSLADANRARMIEQHIGRLVSAHGPYLTGDDAQFSGDGQSFRFACGQPAQCEVRLKLEQPMQLSILDSGQTSTFSLHGESAKFVYEGSQDLTETWPGELRDQALRSISLVQTVENEPRPAFQLRLWTEQPSNCHFQSISQACL
jgi:type II secretory pathway component PulJ